MCPIIFQVTFPGILPRIFLLLGLAIALTVLGLAVLIRARRPAILGIFAAGCALALLFANRVNRPVTMHFVISSFGFSLAISIAVGCCLVTRAAARNGTAPSESIRWLSLSLLGGFLGARLGYILINSNGWSTWRNSLDFESGGLFGYGAYLGGLLGAAVASKGDFRLFRNWLDRATPILLLCTGLTRLGCYLQGCDFGRPLGPRASVLISFLGTFPRWKPAADKTFSGSAAWLHHVSYFGLSTDATTSLPVHPIQLYEAAFAWGTALLAYFLIKPKRFGGRTFLVMAMIFGAGRYSLEFLRGDPDRGLLSFVYANKVKFLGSWSQLLAIGSALASALVWQKWRNGEKTWGGIIRLSRAEQKNNT